MKSPSRRSSISKLSFCLLFHILLTTLCVRAEKVQIPTESAVLPFDDEKVSIRGLGFFRLYWCRCLRRAVRHRRHCRCPQPPRITPFPTIPPLEPSPLSPTPPPKYWECYCDGTVVEVESQDECKAKQEGCSVELLPQATEAPALHWCRCLKKNVRNRKTCCNCEARKCKCWHGWWRNWRRYRRHRAFKHCRRVCRRRRC